MKRLQIAVIGSAGPEEYAYEKPSRRMYEAAETLGKLLGERGCIVVNGGKGGVMEAVCRGAKEAGGITVAEIAGNGRGDGNPYVDVEVVTADAGFRGPSQLVAMSDALISLGGGAGTLQELAVAYRMQKPVVLLPGFGGWTDQIARLDYLDERRLVRFAAATTEAEAVRMAIVMAQGGSDDRTN
jgi:uncharacterized protein (TIGR00725 family)